MTNYTIRLYSPLRVECEMPYEPPWMLGDDYRLLTNYEKILCRNEITEAMQKCTFSEQAGLIARYCQEDIIKKKVLSAIPSVEMKNGRLMSVLTCSCAEALTSYEQDALMDWWEDECLDGYGKELKSTRIRTKRFGRIWVQLWYVAPDCPLIRKDGNIFNLVVHACYETEHADYFIKGSLHVFLLIDLLYKL